MSDQNVKAAQKYLNAMFGGHKDWVKLDEDGKIVDIRKIYKSGVTDSVLDSYRRYLKQ